MSKVVSPADRARYGRAAHGAALTPGRVSRWRGCAYDPAALVVAEHHPELRDNFMAADKDARAVAGGMLGTEPRVIHVYVKETADECC